MTPSIFSRCGLAAALLAFLPTTAGAFAPVAPTFAPSIAIESVQFGGPGMGPGGRPGMAPGARPGMRGPHGYVHRNGHVNRNVNVNRNVHINRNIHVNRGLYRGPNVYYRGGPWRRPGSYWWPAGGAVAAGAALGFIAAASAASWAGRPPAPGYCWYYTSPSRRSGFWDRCP